MMPQIIPTSLTRLEALSRALIAALDGQDVVAIEAAVADFRGAVEEVRAAGGWRDNPEIIDQVASIFALTDAARVRVNFLTDMNRQRLDALNAARGLTATYARPSLGAA